MKKILILCSVILVFLTEKSIAQNIKLGGQLIYGTELNSLGLGAIAEFEINEKISISPSLSFYFPKEQAFIKQSAMEFNGNVNYYFVEQNGIAFYGLAGLNYTSVTAKTNLSGFGFGEFKSTTGRMGLNLGAGANFDLGSVVIPFGEIKYIVSEFDRLVIAAGVKFKI